MKTIYLDNAATTEMSKETIDTMLKYMTNEYGNASSIHHKGQYAKEAIENSRKIIAKSINAKPNEIIFTSGGTESNNFALKGVAFANKSKTKNQIIISKIEHDCILNAAKWLEKNDFEVKYLPVNNDGFIDLNKLKQTITEKTILVSIIHGNNEIGTIQDIREIGKICKEKKVLFHTDACQSYKKVEIDVIKDNIDLMTINAHKIHGPKGVGALYIRNGIKIEPLFHGGGQERNLRSGTENVPGIVGFGKVAELTIDNTKIQKLRDYAITELLKIPLSKLNGPKEKRLPNNINISFAKIEGESIISYLDLFGICASTGSACSSRSLNPSHVMMALENNPERAHGSVRLTLSEQTTKEEIDFTIKILKEAVDKLRKLSPLN